MQPAESLLMHKVWPIVFRNEKRQEILAFEHPLAGLQIVKGTLESSETVAAAAMRELFEEAGVIASGVEHIGSLIAMTTGDEWTFCVCQVMQALPEHWTHFTQDDGGHEFRFFWHPLTKAPDERWHPVFKEALAFLQAQSVRPAA